MVKQREASFLPQFVFTRTYFEASPEPLRESALPDKWVNKHSAPEKTPQLFEELSVPLLNVGLGAAKAVTISWTFPIDQMIERINQLAQRTLTPAYFSRDDWGVSIKSESLGNGTSMWRNQQKVSVDFVLPTSIQKEPVETKLPHAYILLCSALLFFALKDKEEKHSFDVPRLTANIEFTDIGNNTHSATFVFNLNVTAIAGNGNAFTGYIDCTKQA